MVQKKSQPKSSASYQELQTQLDALLAKLEGGELGLDEAITCYEQALALVAELETYLQTAENRVVQLKAQYGTEE